MAIDAENGRFISFGAALAYVEADLVVQMLEAVGPDLNTATFDQVANGGELRYTPLEGGPGALHYPEDHFLPTDCAAIVKIENSAYTLSSRSPATRASPSTADSHDVDVAAPRTTRSGAPSRHTPAKSYSSSNDAFGPLGAPNVPVPVRPTRSPLPEPGTTEADHVASCPSNSPTVSRTNAPW